jgi:transposase, IS5 family
MPLGQLGFYDLDSRLKALSAKGDPLEALEALVPFESFRADIEAVARLAPEERKSNAGRKPFDAVMMFSLQQFPVHWERNENKHAISKAYRMGSILWLAGLELDHRPNPAWLCLLRQPPPRLDHAIQFSRSLSLSVSIR